MSDKPICIYHGNCADGFGAAWAVRKWRSDMDFHAGIYGETPPDVHGREVIMVDFSYKRSALEEMSKGAKSILILDHHKTAAEDLKPFAVEECGGGKFTADTLDGLWSDFDELGKPKIAALFDMDRSGAGLAWDFFHNAPRPKLIDHIEDRDLWRFNLPGTREIQAAVFSYAYDFDIWDKLFDGNPMDLIGEGAAIERKHHKDIAELVAVSKRPMKIGGHIVPVANLPYTLTSDAGNLMAEGQPFAACYMDTSKGRVFSLRSKPDGLDVAEIAKAYGGGGHKNAAGFKMPFDQLGQFEL